MITLYLILAHLIADYPLQPLKIIHWKYKSWRGVAVHVLIHFVVTSLILGLFLMSWHALWLAAILAVFHYAIDLTKAINERKTKRFLLTYWLDQAAHLTSILIVSYIAGLAVVPQNFSCLADCSLFSWFYQPILIAYIALVLFTIYAVEYASYQKKRTQTKLPKHKFNYKAIIRRVFLVTLVYAGFVFILYNLAS